MSEIMEATNDTRQQDAHTRKNKFKLTSFPDYVRKVQTFSQSVTNNNGDGKKVPPGAKRQNLSRAFSCFTSSSNSPNLPCKTSEAVKQPRLPPLHVSRRRPQVKNLQFKPSSEQEATNSSPLRPTAFDELRSDEVAIQRASSFPLTNCTPCSGKAASTTIACSTVTKPKRPAMSKSPYLQPLVHKSYYHKEAEHKTPKGQRKKRTKQQQKTMSTCTVEECTTHEISDKQETSKITESLVIPSITLRTATPSSHGDDMSTCLVDQFTARKQLAAELDKLNREIQDIVVSVEQVEQ